MNGVKQVPSTMNYILLYASLHIQENVIGV